jgi:hypothetical protein
VDVERAAKAVRLDQPTPLPEFLLDCPLVYIGDTRAQRKLRRGGHLRLNASDSSGYIH